MRKTHFPMDKTPVQTDKATIQMDKTAVQMAKVSVQVDKGRVRTDKACDQMDKMAVQMDKMAVQMDKVAVQTDKIPSKWIKFLQKCSKTPDLPQKERFGDFQRVGLSRKLCESGSMAQGSARASRAVSSALAGKHRTAEMGSTRASNPTAEAAVLPRTEIRCSCRVGAQSRRK
jgi:hypothetical protein